MHKLLLVPIVALLAGCAGAPTSSPATSPGSQPSALPTSAVTATTMPGGCGSTSVLKGGVPAWLEAAGDHNNPDSLPYVIATPALAAGFLFAYPLRAGAAENPNNKIFWVVGQPRNGSDLMIAGHPVGAAAPSVAQAQPANSSPGEIYPSIVNVPVAGCWHFDLSWSGHKASVELLYK